MALRVLTSNERQELIDSIEFKAQVKWAIRNYANFMAGNDGTNFMDTEANRIKWAKHRYLSVPIVVTDTYDENAHIQYVKLSKGKQFDLPADDQDAGTILALFISGNVFEEFSPQYFDLIGEQVNFVTSGN